MGSDELALFLRSRRNALQPADIGLPLSPRRRSPGLRREDVADLAAMSRDYYRRLEQARIAPPSPQILDALARALRLSTDERDYLYRVADREPPPQPVRIGRIDPPLRQIVDVMGANPAQIMTVTGETLLQNAAAVALYGDHSLYTGDARYSIYRWFTEPSSRRMHPSEEHEEEGRAQVANLRARSANGNDTGADRLIGLLRTCSAEFERMWQEQQVALCRSGTKTMVHPAFGAMDLQVQILAAESVGQLAVLFTAAGDKAERLRELTASTPPSTARAGVS